MYSDQKENLLNIGYFRLARSLSLQSLHRVQVGAVVAKSKPISASCNIIKTHPKYANPYGSYIGSLHAEIRAIILSGQSLKGASIFVYRELKSGVPALARPCNLCMTVIEESGIKKVYYTTNKYPYYRMERI
jgi:deoxycytidylate deaminase